MRGCSVQTAQSLEKFLVDLVGDAPRVDRVSARAKSPDRFIEKAFKNDDNKSLKYSDPLNEVQDQIGARITVFYISDTASMKELIIRYFSAIEIVKKEPERNSQFGYFGEHFILRIPDDVTPVGYDEDGCPKFFELQIKTLFQHAWSEADHDLGYKTFRELDPLEQRQLAFSAAQAWGADQIFEDLAGKLLPPADGHAVSRS